METVFLTEDSTQFNLPWETLGSLVNGVSAIDLTRMPIRTLEEAYSFLLNYGYDTRNLDDLDSLQSILRESVRFIDTYLLGDAIVDWQALGEPPSPEARVPVRIYQRESVEELLLTASQPNIQDRAWACAILKVMHTVSHIDNNPLFRSFDTARDQILNRFETVLVRDDNTGEIYLGSPGTPRSLRIFGFDTKDQKARESVLIKLLSKKEHVAERVEDLMGIRIVTYTAAEAILALDLLRQLEVVVFPNIIPSRSRNTLIDFDQFKEQYEALLSQEQQPSNWWEIQQWVQRFKTVLPAQTFNDHNPLSSGSYRSIHITCRQLIRFDGELPWHEQRLFFPYEIQITDRANFLESLDGESAHHHYKQRQLIRARRRVLAGLMPPSTPVDSTETM